MGCLIKCQTQGQHNYFCLMLVFRSTGIQMQPCGAPKELWQGQFWLWKVYWGRGRPGVGTAVHLQRGWRCPQGYRPEHVSSVRTLRGGECVCDTFLRWNWQKRLGWGVGGREELVATGDFLPGECKWCPYLRCRATGGTSRGRCESLQVNGSIW